MLTTAAPRKALPRWLKPLLVAEGFAALWWSAAIVLRRLNIVPVWFDQQDVFMVVGKYATSPYAHAHRFVNPPWTALILAPFAQLPLEAATLLQLCLYFTILAAVILKFGGSLRAVVITLSSFVAFTATLELNVEWIAILGLLVPPAASGIFLLVKPQLALGYWLTFNRKQLALTVAGIVIAGAVSYLIWGNWLAEVGANNAQGLTGVARNMAPSALVTRWISFPLGLLVGWRAFRKKDAILSILAWVCFVPYLPFYSLVVLLALASIRWWKLAALISVVMWLVYGGVVALALLMRH